MTTNTIVVGVDPSLTKSGVVCSENHIFIETKPLANETYFQCLRRRSDEIGSKLTEFIKQQYNPLRHDVLVVCEGPMLNAGESRHLFEVGWLMEHFETELRKLPRLQIVYIQPSNVKKFLGDGSAPKKHDKKCGQIKKLKKGDKLVKCVPCLVFDKYGVKFERDSGADKAHAYALYRIGQAILDETFDYKEIPRRGKGK